MTFMKNGRFPVYSLVTIEFLSPCLFLIKFENKTVFMLIVGYVQYRPEKPSKVRIRPRYRTLPPPTLYFPYSNLFEKLKQKKSLSKIYF